MLILLLQLLLRMLFWLPHLSKHPEEDADEADDEEDHDDGDEDKDDDEDDDDDDDDDEEEEEEEEEEQDQDQDQDDDDVMRMRMLRVYDGCIHVKNKCQFLDTQANTIYVNLPFPPHTTTISMSLNKCWNPRNEDVLRPNSDRFVQKSGSTLPAPRPRP